MGNWARFPDRDIGPQNGPPGVFTDPEQEQHRENLMTASAKKDRERKAAETAIWEPDVPHVDRWIEEAMDPDDETDSWVAQTEKELFEEMDGDEDDDFDEEEQFEGNTYNAQAGLGGWVEDEDEDDEEEFAEDEFAEDDFAEDAFQASDIGFAPNAFPASELDGWVLDDDDDTSKAQKDEENLKMGSVERIFDEEDDDWER